MLCHKTCNGSFLICSLHCITQTAYEHYYTTALQVSKANVACNHASWLQRTNYHTHNVCWHDSGLPAILAACVPFCSSATDLSKSLASFRSKTGMKICNNRAKTRQNSTGINIHCKEQIPKELRVSSCTWDTITVFIRIPHYHGECRFRNLIAAKSLELLSWLVQYYQHRTGQIIILHSSTMKLQLSLRISKQTMGN